MTDTVPHAMHIPDGEPAKYDRDVLVREISAYYEFLTDLYIPKSALGYPPPGGWPHLTDDFLANLGKNKTVMDLIRHLPYFEHDGGDR